MKVEYKNDCKGISWDALSSLYQASNFGFKSQERLKKVFGNSQYVSFAYHDDELIGASRAFSDGVDCAVICDMAVLPAFQRKGIGSLLLKNLLNSIGNQYHRIMLYATLGKESFYKQHGFHLMTSAMCIFKNQEKAIEHGYVLK
ncbi:MAG: GNAT family N-acetyltransferase [Chitinophagales bacterium]|nr:GNAT family N-acetyltransferase [Chitinophagales bacterium]